jgi:hypothetical protein
MNLTRPSGRWNTASLAVRCLLGTAAAVAALAMAPGAAGAHNSSLPQVPGPGRPGPGLLYAPPASSPILENTGPWRAKPLMVSGAEA